MAVANTWKGTVALIASFLVASIAIGRIPLASQYLGPAGQAALNWLVCAGVGSWVAQRGFWLPTASFWLANWAVVVAVLYWIAAPSGQASVAGILGFNAAALAASAGAAMLGASVGAWRSRADGRPGGAIC